MTPLNQNDFIDHVEATIGRFQRARLKGLSIITLSDILTRSNPYLLTEKNILIGSQLVRNTLDAFLNSEDESLFGDLLKDLAIFVCNKVHGGEKSRVRGIDLQFGKDQVIYIVSIKSGPNWGNSRQIATMKADFKRARRMLQTNNSNANVIAVNGCCYGRCRTWNQEEYWGLCGQKFWKFLSGDAELYKKIIEPLGHYAKKSNNDYDMLYAQIFHRLLREVLTDFLTDDLIAGNRLVEYVSAETMPQFVRAGSSGSDS